jgi:hypothetical protein
MPTQPGFSSPTMSNNPKSRASAYKPPLHLVPLAALEACAAAFQHGGCKYGYWDWRGYTVSAEDYVRATIGHVKAWHEARDTDPESGVSHLGHAMASIAILLDAERHGLLYDDRPTRPILTPGPSQESDK